jgi:putative transposase
MTHAWRIEFEGVLYHVLSRGNERRDIFFDDDDRRLFLDTLNTTILTESAEPPGA